MWFSGVTFRCGTSEVYWRMYKLSTLLDLERPICRQVKSWFSLRFTSIEMCDAPVQVMEPRGYGERNHEIEKRMEQLAFEVT